MNIDKRNNHYRVREMRNGQLFSYSFDHRPSKLEATLKLNELESRSFNVNKSIINAMNEYIESKENILSPSTINGYYKIIKRIETRYPWFAKININNLTRIKFQQLINELSKVNKPKTVKNTYGLIRSSIDMFGKMDMKITLPQDIKPEPYLPTDAEVSLLLKESKPTPYYVPIRLALYSLRLSEIMALEMTDIYDNYVDVHKAKVKGPYTYVIKSTKTRNSTRKVYVDKELIGTIRNQGYIYNGFPHQITVYIKNFCKTYKIQNFTLHRLRHFFASQLHSMNIPRKVVEKLGGWEAGSHILDRVYTHQKSDIKYTDAIIAAISSLNA